MSRLAAEVVGIGLWTEGLEGWPRAIARFDGKPPEPTDAPRRPAATILPANERRRAPEGVAVALEVAHEALTMSGLAPGTVASVFASAYGDLAIVDYLCATLADDPMALSPTRFHHSVHNAAAGYWSMASASHAPSTSLAAGDDSFAAGLLEALTQVAVDAAPVLLVAFDTPAPPALMPATASTRLFGVALLLARPGIHSHPLARLQAEVTSTTSALPLPVDSALHAIARSNPCARGLAFAEALRAEGSTILNYPVGTQSTLTLEVTPLSTTSIQ